MISLSRWEKKVTRAQLEDLSFADSFICCYHQEVGGDEHNAGGWVDMVWKLLEVIFPLHLFSQWTNIGSSTTSEDEGVGNRSLI